MKKQGSAASDPNIIYGYYDNVENELRRLKITDRPECVWNIDEISLFTDPRKVKVIAPKGEKASRVQATSGREAITVMAAISANGDYLPPLIIFKGKYMQSTWNPAKPYPGTKLAISENGWMTSDIFFDWFCAFCIENTQRPILMVFDGHSTHLTSRVVMKAKGEDITIIKLPPHTTDRLQPLDVCCFKPLKVQWDKAIAKWNTEHKAVRLTKAAFVELVGNVWSSAFSIRNIKKSFEKTGLYPVNRYVYPESIFNPDLYHVYKEMKVLERSPQFAPIAATPKKNMPELMEPEVPHCSQKLDFTIMEPSKPMGEVLNPA